MRTKLHLIPGTLCNENVWSILAPYLKHDFELVYLTIPRDKNFDEIANYYNETLTDERLNLVGFSLGGYIATHFALMFPQRVEKLFIISNSSTSLPKKEISKRSNTLNFIRFFGFKKPNRSMIADLFDKETQTKDRINIMMEMVLTQGESELLSQYRNTTQRADLATELNLLSVPICFYYSQSDPLVNPTWFATLTAKPSLNIVSTQGTGHMLPLEKPTELVALIVAWAKLTGE
jgi:pimeloyl-ACP methyl ester carboxylesterase